MLILSTVLVKTDESAIEVYDLPLEAHLLSVGFYFKVPEVCCFPLALSVSSTVPIVNG